VNKLATYHQESQFQWLVTADPGDVPRPMHTNHQIGQMSFRHNVHAYRQIHKKTSPCASHHRSSTLSMTEMTQTLLAWMYRCQNSA